LLVGGLLTWINKMFALGWDVSWFWKHVVGRALLSVVPGSWFALAPIEGGINAATGQADSVSVLTQSWQQFANMNIWIGAITGVAMIYVAIRLRRWRDEG
jgi:ABC-2 type transport system permease protein